MAASEQRTEPLEARRETATQTVEVEHLDDTLAAALHRHATWLAVGAVDGEPTERRFEWAVDRLTQVNMEAAALVERNATSIALMRALSERIDRSNRENRRTLDQIVGDTST